jgi:hypothetical protein
MTRHIFLLLLSFFLTGVDWAQPKNEDDYTRLARLSYIEGPVSYQHATDVDWAAASVNLPLEPGDRIYTSPDGRAEIEFDDGSVYRLARNTDIEILSLRENLIQLRMLVGLSTLIVTSDTDFEINTPAAAFNTLNKGSYRFSVDENGDSDAIVRKGKLEAANNSFSRRIESGEMLRVTLRDSGNPEFVRYERRDDWDEWNDRRNADLNVYAGRKYLPDTVYIGVSDLHRHGRWVEIETYGSAWVPYSVDISWSPYSVGRWCYRPLFGWTWISYEPWGWLPYHYGRWYRSSMYGWCWLPGPAFAFNFWSPGLVAFYNGPGWISWCPLGPGDYYNVNHYHFNRGIYGHQLDQLAHFYSRDRGNLFNRDVPHAFRTAPIDRFRNGSFGDRNREANWANVDQPWKHGELVNDSLSIRPTATSYRAAPDRQAVQPARARSLPAVARSSPGYNSRGQDHITRITNPQIPSLPSRAERMQSAREETTSRAGARPTARVMQTPQTQRANPAAQTPSGNGFSEQSGRRMETSRWSRITGNDRENSKAGDNPVPAVRPDTNPSATRQSTPRARSERAAPEQKQTIRTPSETKPNSEDRRQNNTAEPRSRTNGESRSDSSAIVTTPRADTTRTYYSYRQSSPSVEQDSDVRSYSNRSYSAPSNSGSGGNGSMPFQRANPSVEQNNGVRSYSYRSYSAPSNSGSGGGNSMSLGRSSPSFGQSGGTRSFSTPSYGGSGGNGSSFSGRSSGGGSFSRSGGGGAQRSQDRGSSGGGRSRR